MSKAYDKGANAAAIQVEVHGLAGVVSDHCYIVGEGTERDLPASHREYHRGVNDVLLLLASEPYEAPRTFAEVESYERGFTLGESYRKQYGLASALFRHKQAIASWETPRGAMRSRYAGPHAMACVRAFAVGESDALLLAATARDCGDCYRGVKHVHGEAR